MHRVRSIAVSCISLFVFVFLPKEETFLLRGVMWRWTGARWGWRAIAGHE